MARPSKSTRDSTRQRREPHTFSRHKVTDTTNHTQDTSVSHTVRDHRYRKGCRGIAPVRLRPSRPDIRTSHPPKRTTSRPPIHPVSITSLQPPSLRKRAVTHLLVPSFPVLHLAFLGAIYQSKSKKKGHGQRRVTRCKGASSFRHRNTQRANRHEGHARQRVRVKSKNCQSYQEQGGHETTLLNYCTKSFVSLCVSL